MTRKRTFGTRAALGGLTAAVALMTAPLAATADEVADLKANQELLQQRVDQLAQAQVPGNLFGVGGPPGPVNVQMTGGSFPRSFLIPGTDTSIRVGGEIRLLSLFWITGGNPNTFPSTNAGTTGQLNSIPLTGTPPNSSNAHKPGARSGRLRHVAAAVETERRDAHPDRLGRGAQLYRIRLRGRRVSVTGRYRRRTASFPACAMPTEPSARCCSARPTRTSTIPTPAWKAWSSAV